MPIEVRIHDKRRWVLAACLVALIVLAVATAINRKSNRISANAEPKQAERLRIDDGVSSDSPELRLEHDNRLLVPVIALRVDDASLERYWSAELASVLGGKTEAPVKNGRVDVLTATLAIEVDRKDKWHEGIGQSIHYADATGAMPVLALIVDSDHWPMNDKTADEIRYIDKVCLSKGIKLVLLRRQP